DVASTAYSRTRAPTYARRRDPVHHLGVTAISVYAAPMLRARDTGIRSVRIGCDRVFVDSVDRYLAAWARKLRLRGVAVQRLIARRLAAGMTAVDVGANVGWHTLALARRVGASGRVVALEPDAR